MSKRNRTPATTTAGGRARSAPIKIDKPKPWGTIAVALLLAAALIGIIVYAVFNTGSGVRDLLAEEDASFEGLQVVEDPANNHVAEPVDYPGYPDMPPVGGPHSSLPQQCAVYEEQIPAEHAVHSLEHGAVWVTYSDELADDQVETLVDLVEGDPHRLLSPLPEQESPVVATAWGRQLPFDSADDDKLEDFLQIYTNGRQAPEKGAPCAGNTETGTTPFVAAQPQPEPTG